MLSLSRVHPQRRATTSPVARRRFPHWDTPTRGGFPNRAEFQALSQSISPIIFSHPKPTGCGPWDRTAQIVSFTVSPSANACTRFYARRLPTSTLLPNVTFAVRSRTYKCVMAIRAIILDLLKNVGRGFLMGGADIIPGVSGGTVALILGILRTAGQRHQPFRSDTPRSSAKRGTHHCTAAR